MTAATGPGPGDADLAGASGRGSSPRGGPPRWFAALGIGGLVLGALLVVAQALGIGSGSSARPATMPPTGEAAQRTHELVSKALTDAAFQVTDPQTPYRPGESPSLVAVPRRLLQVVIPSQPAGGFIVIYELPTNGDAERVGQDFATYLVSGPGAIQYPRDTQFVIRRAGRTLVFFPWSREVNPDPRVAEIAAVLETVGVAIGTP